MHSVGQVRNYISTKQLAKSKGFGGVQKHAKALCIGA